MCIRDRAKEGYNNARSTYYDFEIYWVFQCERQHQNILSFGDYVTSVAQLTYVISCTLLFKSTPDPIKHLHNNYLICFKNNLTLL